ncbi:glycosyl hydrolase [Bacteroidota bacterium]
MKYLPNFLILILLFSCQQTKQDKLVEEFQNPPNYTKPWVYWYWIDENISREGITKDLEAMSRVGIGEALIGHISPGGKKGNVDMLGEEWWMMVVHAVKEGQRLGVDIGFFNGPGWAQSGGPWIGADQSMRYVVSRKKLAKGPGVFKDSIPVGITHFEDISIQAFPKPKGETDSLSWKIRQLKTTPPISTLLNLMDGDLASEFIFAEGSDRNDPLTVDIYFSIPINPQSITFHPIEDPFFVLVELQVPDEKGGFRTIRKFDFDRRRTTPSEGPMIYAPLIISFPQTRSDRFRLVFSNLGGHWKAGFKEIELSEAARVDHVIEKMMGKMYPDPLPPWDAYLWSKPVETSSDYVVESKSIIDLSGNINQQGLIEWNIPEGEWIILRTGMAPTGVTNVPVPPQATGYDCDKMDKDVIQKHFRAYLGDFLAKVPEEERKSLKHIVIDSYEAGSQNWSPVLKKHFIERYEYDPIPWLPVLSGRVVENTELSDRFLWDVRRLTADLIAENYVGGLREIANENGLKLWVENYGHWGFPGEFLLYGGQADEVAGEFWVENPYWDLGSIECRAASSAAHIYGKTVASAEAYTAGFNFRQTPASMKARGDWVFTEGINHTVLHVYIHQPSEEIVPGVTAWFGMSFQRNNTWFNQSKTWIDYMRRCHYLLQQGKHVADVCYFIGEDSPKMTGVREPELPDGYNFDYINAEVIIKRLKVENGLLKLPDGMSYRLMVLPPLKTMRPAVLRKIRQLVSEGATILGPPPQHSPSMAGYPDSDRDVTALAKEIWANCDGESVTEIQYNQGKVFNGISLEDAFDRMKVTPDLICADTGIVWTHRRSEEVDIYFLSNQHNQKVEVDISFRMEGKSPEFWFPDNGNMEKAPCLISSDNRTIIPIIFNPHGSVFVVFRKIKNPEIRETISYDNTSEIVVDGPWEIHFTPGWDTPEQIELNNLMSWTELPDEGIRHFSGTAVYHKTFTLSKPFLENDVMVSLDLGKVASFAEVVLNGMDLGVAWKPPYVIDITGAAKQGENQLEIRITNTWWNRLIGDEKYPDGFPGSEVKKPRTSVTHKAWSKEDELLPAGLMGPVKIRLSY